MQKLASFFLLFLFLFSIVQFAQTNPPTNLSARLVGTNMHLAVELSWQYNQTTTPVKFSVYKKNGGIADTGNFFKIFSGYSNQKKYTDSHVQPGKKYSYYVTAVINNIASNPSDTVEIAVVAPVIAYGKISGTLLNDSTNAPIFRGKVQFLPSNSTSNSVYSVSTDSNGFFTCKLKTGDYFLYSSAQGYVGEYYDNVPTKLLATIVTLAENDSLVFNIGLKKIIPPPPPVLYTVTGWVKDQANVQQKAELRAYVTNRGHNHPSCQGVYVSRTDSLGNYKFMVKAGDTIIVFCAPFNHTLKPEYWDNKFTFNEADKIPVNTNITDINFVLEPKPIFNNGISGTVKDSAAVLSLKANVYAYKKLSAGNLGKRYFVKTDSLTGVYIFNNLEPGNYILSASSRGYKSTYFRYDGTPTRNWREADSVVVTETGIVNSIDFRLRMFNHVSGDAFVYGEIQDNSGNVLDATLIHAYNSEGDLVGSTISELDGSYQISGLIPGNYSIQSNMINYQDVALQNVVISEMNSISEINLALVPEGVTAIEDDSFVASQFELNQNYPNPFNPSTTISFSLAKETNVRLVVYNVLGQQVAQLISSKMNAGYHEVTFDANKLTSGIYFYSLDTENYSSVKKMILQK